MTDTLTHALTIRGQQGLWRITGCDDGHGGAPTRDFYDERRYFDAWALKQWRKARETR